MRINNKGQSALEFLMTYGWAILVVLAAIGALAYFGVLNPSNFLPDQCTASTGFGCVGKPVVNGSTVRFIVTNGAGSDIVFYQGGITLTSSSQPCATSNVFFCEKTNTTQQCANTAYYSSKTVRDGQDFQILINCNTTGNVHKSTLTLEYNNSLSGLPDQMTVQVSGKKK